MKLLLISLLFSAKAFAQVPLNCVVNAVIKVESSGVPDKVSQDGTCSGLMQLQLATAQDMGFEGEEKDLLRGETNKKYGTLYIKWLLNRYHNNLFVALDAYNRGILNVEKYPYKKDWSQHSYVGPIIRIMQQSCPNSL